MNRTQSLRDKSFDADEWQKLYYRNQQQYIRQRLSALKWLQEGQSRAQVSEQVGCSYDTLTSWISVNPRTATATESDGAETTTDRLLEQQLNQFFDSHQFLSAQQVQKTLNFIFSLVP
jgi:transposase